MYPFSDKRRNDSNTADIVWDMYSDNPGGPDPYTYTFGTNQCGSYSGEGDCYNREHTTPQSWFANLSPMVSDAHHIFPTDGKVNALHSNYPYGEVTTIVPQTGYNNPSLAGSKLGTGTNFGYSGIVFEPINEYKGDFARAILYMAVRYEDEIISQNWSNIGTANAAFLSTTDQSNAATRRLQIYDDWYLKTMYKWHIQDPVSQKEIDRNNVIYSQLISDGTQKKQGNRNPFVDRPEYVAAIWGNLCLPGVLPVDFVAITAQRNNNTVVIKWKVANELNINSYEIERSINGSSFEKVGKVNANNFSSYSFIDNNLPKATVVYYRVKALELDGTKKNSKIVSVKLYNNNAVLVYPNPTNNLLNIKLSNALVMSSTLQITDISGKLIRQLITNTGQSNITIDVTMLAAGKYILKMVNGTEVINESFVVTK